MTTPVADLVELRSAETAALKRLTRDIKEAARTLTPDEVRYLVGQYYAGQNLRIRAGHQMRKLVERAAPHDTLAFFAKQFETVERQIIPVLDKWSDTYPLGVWAKSTTGVGPIIAAGLLAHIDIEQAPTAGHIWAFAGLDPSKTWEKKQKRPYNAALKTLCFKLGESFVKVQNHDADIYGKVYAARKLAEQEHNEAGDFAELAAVRVKQVDKRTDAYKAYAAGKLPPAHIHARARRYAAKLFLAHYHCVGYFLHYETMPPFPYVFSHLPGHVHYVAPPHADLIPGLSEALRKYERQLRKGN